MLKLTFWTSSVKVSTIVVYILETQKSKYLSVCIETTADFQNSNAYAFSSYNMTSDRDNDDKVLTYEMSS